MLEPDDIIRAARDGSRWAGTAMVTVVAPVLMGYAAAIASDLSSTDHEVIVERAIEKGVAKIDKFDRRRGTFVGWLRPFVRNEINTVRRERGSSLEPLTDDAPAPDIDVAVSPERETEVAALDDCLRQLSETDRLIILLREYEHLGYEQCAERIGGVSAAACRVRHFRAIKRLGELAKDQPSLAHYYEENK